MLNDFNRRHCYRLPWLASHTEGMLAEVAKANPDLKRLEDFRRKRDNLLRIIHDIETARRIGES